MDTNRDERLRQQYHQLLTSSSSSSSTSSNTDALRKLLLLQGLPSDANALQTPMFGRCSLRGLIWKVLLGIGHVDVDEYTRLVKKGPSIDDSRVREDARRTFAKSDDFTTRVPTSKIIRLLNAYVMYHGDIRGIYAQSMSLLAAPFLYIMPEPDAFHCFRRFLDFKVTSYIEKYAGATSACQLLDRCIMKCLPDLHKILNQHNLYAEVYAFPVMSSLGMCVRPVFDTVRLWDIILGFGIHMHIIFTLARLAIRSDDIVKEAKLSGAAPISTRELEQGFGLDAKTVLSKGVTMSAQLDEDLYDELICHTSTASWSSKSRLTSKSNPIQQLANHLSNFPTQTHINNNVENHSTNRSITNSSTNTTMNSRSSSVDRHGNTHDFEFNETLDVASHLDSSAHSKSRNNHILHHNNSNKSHNNNQDDDNDFSTTSDLQSTETSNRPDESTNIDERAARRGIRTSYDLIQQQNFGD